MSNNPGRVRIAAISMIAAVPLLAGCSDDSTTVANASSASGNQQGAESKSPPAPTLPNGDLEASSLLAYLRARYDFVAKDQFSAPFDDKALIGRRFKVEIPEAEAEGDHWPITFQYDADKQLLTLSLDSSSDFYGDTSGQFTFIPLERKTTYLPKQMMQTAFGVTAEVTPTALAAGSSAITSRPRRISMPRSLQKAGGRIRICSKAFSPAR